MGKQDEYIAIDDDDDDQDGGGDDDDDGHHRHDNSDVNHCEPGSLTCTKFFNSIRQWEPHLVRCKSSLFSMVGIAVDHGRH